MTSTISDSQPKMTHYRWLMLALCALTPLFVSTLPTMSLPPMFTVISADLNLTLVEIGTVWGAQSLMGIFFSLLGGILGDRFGTRRTLVSVCLLTGIFGMMRGFATDFTTLLLATILMSAFQMIIPIVIFKVIRQWMPPERLGMASGITSAGFATGLMLGPLLSTSVIMPALGGWRQVLIFYGIIAIAFSVIWFVATASEKKHQGDTHSQTTSLMNNLRHVISLRNVWILGLAGLGIGACFRGFTGYMPTYLKDIGWPELAADQALSAFFLASLIGVVPLSTLSDRLQIRRGFLAVAALILATGIGSLAFVPDNLILIVIAATGLVFDSFMAILNATVMEVDGVGHLYAGTALGFANTIRSVGMSLSPPIGNSLAIYGLSTPFLFWGGLGFLGVFIFIFVFKSPKRKRVTA
ncbi:MAG: MFS transporter [Anaerolineaceae bacterium]|nr:MFS transporter [Anaerolineaceae bacterium]